MEKQSTEPTEDPRKDKCSSCGRTISEFEGAYTTEEGLICIECNEKVSDKKTLLYEKDDSETIAKPSMEMYLNLVSSSHWYVLTGSCIIGWICLAILIFLPNNVFLQGVTTLGRIVAASVCLVLLYRFWEPLQVLNLRIKPFFVIFILFIPFIIASLILLVPLFRWEISKAINLLYTLPFLAFGILISLLSIYWIFRAFWGWTLLYNKIISKFQLKILTMSTGLGFLASSAPFLIGIILFKAPQNMHSDDALLLILICLIFFDIVYILFYRTALVATNSLIEQIEFGES